MVSNKTNDRKQESVPLFLIAYHVNERGEKSFWTRIGAAWGHRDGEGLTVDLDLVLLDGGRIVLRPLKDEKTNEDQVGALAPDYLNLLRKKKPRSGCFG